jgi:hypothetical protein
MMELVHWLCIMILMVLFSVSALAQEGPHSPLYTIDLSSLVPQGAPPNANGTVVFLTDHVIAVVCATNRHAIFRLLTWRTAAHERSARKSVSSIIGLLFVRLTGAFY